MSIESGSEMIGGSHSKEISMEEGNSGGGEIHEAVGSKILHIRELKLYKMDNLMHLGRGMMVEIQILEVEQCSRLIENLESFSISFQNIMTLKVTSCEGLRYLMTYSVAKSFVQLTTMEVRSCKGLAAIVGSNITGYDGPDDAEPSMITFSSLQNLTLFDLPGLQGFCSTGKCRVKFQPSTILQVQLCPIQFTIAPDGFLKQEWTDRAKNIKQSYDQLDDTKLQELFLLCGITLRGDIISFEDLFRYCMGLGYFGEAFKLEEEAFKLEEARKVLHEQIKKLKDKCLLGDNNDSRYVKMAADVRDVAYQIAISSECMLTLREYGGDREKEWSDKFLEKCTIMSLPFGNKGFSEDMHCPSLEMFLLQGDLDDESHNISPTFFGKIRNLKVLSLRCMTIPPLRTSFLLMKNLKSLCLDKCKLGDVALIGELVYLEVLSLSESDIKQLPEEVRALINLRLLDLTGCSELEVISPGVISSLRKLEELRMRNSFNKWGIEGESSNASLSELKHLTKLSALEVHIPNAGIIPANLFSPKLERFNIIVGDAYIWEKPVAETTLNTLKVKLTTGIEELDDDLKNLVKRSEDLSFSADGVSNILHGLDTKEFEHLTYLQFQGNIDFTPIIIKRKLVFPHLRTLRVDRCDRPSLLFSFSRPESLADLKNLEISACKLVEGSLSSTREKSEENMDNMFSKQDDLKLDILPNITRFCSGSIEKLDLEGWVKLGEYNAAMRKDTESNHTEENLDVNSQITIQYFLFDLKAVFPDLTILKVHGCSHLRSVFSVSIAKSLLKLQSLEISTCEIIEEIVASASEEGQENMENLFPKLETLKLNELPSLVRFCSGTYVQIPSLKNMDIQGCTKLGPFIFDNNVPVSGKDSSISCEEVQEKDSARSSSSNTLKYSLLDEKVDLPKLTNLVVQGCNGLSFLASMRKSLVQLEKLEISECQIMEVVLEEECWANSSSVIKLADKLSELKLKYLPCLDGLCRAGEHSHFDFESLEELHIEKCTQLGTWITYDSSSRNSLFDQKVNFPKLKVLTIIGLPKLKRIWHPVFSDSFSNLRDLTVQQCSSLKNIFPDSIIGNKWGLEKLTVRECGVVQEIISQEYKGELSLFQKLKHLEFTSLIQLERLCKKMPSFSWQKLETLKLFDCQTLDILAAELPGRQETNALPSSHRTLASKLFAPAKKPKLLTPVKQSPILFNENSFPKLQDLTFAPRSMNICYGRSTCEKAVFAGCSNGKSDGSLQHLKTLRLHGLEKTMRLWQKIQSAGQEFPKLEILEVKFCGLTNQDLSSMSFQNLTTLEVNLCWRLQYLMTYKVAEKLGRQLKKLKVEECKNIRQILASDEGIGEDDSKCVIDFSELTHLELADLISLERFCSSNCTVKVPRLRENLKVEYCLIELKINSEILEVGSNVQKSHSSKEATHTSNATEYASSSEENQKQPAANAREGAEHIERNARELHDDNLTDGLHKYKPALPCIVKLDADIGRLEEELRAKKAERDELQSQRETGWQGLRRCTSF